MTSTGNFKSIAGLEKGDEVALIVLPLFADDKLASKGTILEKTEEGLVVVSPDFSGEALFSKAGFYVGGEWEYSADGEEWDFNRGNVIALPFDEEFYSDLQRVRY